MRWLSISALFVAGACNALLGLESTIGDRDGDGIADQVDNCPDEPNADQLDTDGNGVGDACRPQCVRPTNVDLDDDGIDDGCDTCIGGDGEIGMDTDGDGLDDGCDPCLGGTGVTGMTENIGGVGTLGRDENHDGLDDGCLVCFAPIGVDIDNDGLDDACDACLAGPPHDEDGDGIDDGCDNCPGDPNPDQMANNEPAIGDVCDAELVSARGLFDPFLTAQEPAVWLPSPGFTVENDRLLADSTGAGGPITRTTTTAPVHGRFRIVLGIAAQAGSVGFRLRDVGRILDIACTLRADGFVELVAGTESSTSANKLSVESGLVQLLATVQNGFAGTSFNCVAISAEDTVVASVLGSLALEEFALEIEVDGTAELTYVDAVGQM